MMRPLRDIVRQVKAETLYGGYVYLDRLKQGRRSLKVDGWRKCEYVRCALLLEEHNYTVREIKYSHKKGSGMFPQPAFVQIRLHITDPR